MRRPHPTALLGLAAGTVWACTLTPEAAKGEPPKELQVEVTRCYQSPKRLIITSETKTFKLALTPEQKKKLEEKKGKVTGPPKPLTPATAPIPTRKPSARIVTPTTWVKTAHVWTKTTVNTNTGKK